MDDDSFVSWDWTEYKMYSIGGSVDTLGLGTQYSAQIANVGDLDGNGSDELFLGFGAVTISSYEYRILTFRKGAWHVLTEDIHCRGDVLDYLDSGKLVRKTQRPGYLQIKTTREVWLDSLGNMLPEPIDFDSDECLDLVGIRDR